MTYSHLISRSVFTLALLGSAALLGSNGRMIADEYCRCLNLQEKNDNVIAAVDLFPYLPILLQSVFSHWVTLNLGQSTAFAVSFSALMLSVWSFLFLLMKIHISPRANGFFAPSGLAAGIIVFSLTSQALVFGPPILEAITQQGFLAQVFLRYAGITITLAGAFSLMSIFLVVVMATKIQGRRKASLVFVIGAFAGLMHPYFIAVFLFLAGFYILKFGPYGSDYNKQERRNLIVSAFGGTSLSFGFSLLTAGASYTLTKLQTGPRTSFWNLETLLDSLWTMAAWVSLPTIIAFLGGIVLGLAFELKAHRRARTLSVVLFLIAFTVYLSLSAIAGAIISYPAPWHVLTSRMFLTIGAMALGLFVSGEFAPFGDVKTNLVRRISQVSLLALSTVLFMVSSSWATSLPGLWAAGHLPLRTVLEGPGSGLIWGDTEDPGSLACYLEIEPRLKEKKLSIDLPE